jgi:hypothetical protein
MPDPGQMGALADQNIDWSRYNQPFGQLGDPNPELYKVPYTEGIRPSDIDRAIGIGLSFSGGGLATKAPKVAPRMGEVLAPEAAPDVSAAAPYLSNVQRIANPGVYKDPRLIAAEAAANVAPEHPALKELFGVTRDDLYGISQQGRRQGNIEPQIWQPGKATKINEAAASIMNPANAQRLIDTMAEAQKYPELIKGMVPWYVMDPAYQQMVRLVGPERAAAEYTKFNMHVAPFSAGSPVPLELTRGTAANMMINRGEYPAFQQYGGMPPGKRPEDIRALLQDVPGHLMHKEPAKAVARYLETGEHGFAPDTVKIPLYTQASGVPETGFQTRLPVPDTHFASAIGAPEVRAGQDFRGFMSGAEYRPVGPWFREQVAKPLDLEAVPGQALMWGTYGPQTGVKTAVGAGKLELLAQNIWDRAQKLGIDPKKLRDDVLTGKAHASWLLGGLAGAGMMGGIARQDNYETQ